MNTTVINYLDIRLGCLGLTLGIGYLVDVELDIHLESKEKMVDLTRRPLSSRACFPN